METLYYTGSKWTIGNATYPMYICKGIRGRGKTTSWLKQCVEWALKDENNKFVYLRRTAIQMELALEKGLFNGVRKAYKEFAEMFTGDTYEEGKIILHGANNLRFHAGYYYDLNTVKGISVEDCNVLLFDEYIEPTRNKYKGGEQGIHEPELFLRLCETLFRNRPFWVILLGNQDSNTNPYDEYFRIPFGVQKYRDKGRLWYEFDTSSVAIEHKNKTTIGRLSAGTSYAEYTNGKSSMNDVDSDLIMQVGKNAKQICNIKIFGSNLTLWYDDNTSIEYVTDDRGINNQYPVMCVSTSDMCIDSNFIAYNTAFLQMQKLLYSKGKIRFNNQKTASLFYLMIKLQ